MLAVFEALPTTFAQSSALGRVLPWIVGLMLFAVAAGVALMVVRKHILADADEDDSPPMLISDLRHLHKEGKLTDQEFAKAKGALVAGVRSQASPELAAVRERAAINRPAKAPPPKPHADRVAPPGVDLTGAPLPKPTSDPDTGSQPDSEPRAGPPVG